MGGVPMSTLDDKAVQSGDENKYKQEHVKEYSMAQDILNGTII